ncbi:MAG: electron transfer flavoprotein subunit beta, partial [Tumebacillaceae bacterium]
PGLDRAKIGLKGSPTIVAKTWVPEQKHVQTEWVEADSAQEIAAQLVEKLWQTELPTRFGWQVESGV